MNAEFVLANSNKKVYMSHAALAKLADNSLWFLYFRLFDHVDRVDYGIF